MCEEGSIFFGRLEDVLTRDPDLLPLQATKETDAIIPWRAVLSTGLLLGLPLEDKTSVAEGSRLKEVVASGGREVEGKMLR